MAPTFPSIDNATLKALRKGDVGALEKIHRALYSTLVAEAGRQGGDPTFGPTVAELAMLQLWENHANFENAEELEQAAHTAVRGGVTREQRRRASHKEGAKAAGGTSADAVWQRIKAEVAKSSAVPAGSKHGAVKHHVEKINSDGGRGVMIAVGVILLIGAAVGGWYVMQSGEHGVATGSFTLPDAKSISVTAGQRGNLPLGPGDTAAIGSATKLTVGGDYGTKVRAVRVDGSASFRVSSGPRFEVNAREASIVTTSGSFAVRAYKDDPAIIVRVKEGEVKVDAGKESRTVAAGKSVSIAKDGTISDPSAEVVDQALGWTDGHVAFTNAPLNIVMAEFGRWYNLPLTTKDSSLLARPVTMSVALESKKEAIDALEQSASVKFSYDKDSKPVLANAPPKPAGKAAGKPVPAAKKKK